MKITTRGLEAGTRAGWLLLAGLGAFLLWRMFRPRGVEVVPILPPAPPVDSGSPPEPREAAPPEGIVAGGLVSSLRAQIVTPSRGGRADRRAFSAMFPVTIEVVNQSHEAQDAQVEVVIDFDEFMGGSRVGIRTLLPRERIPANSVRRLEVELDSGNVNGITYEFGQAYAAVVVRTNGKVTQATSFEVW